MALTRKYLKAMGIEDEKIDQIIEAHAETVTGLKDSLDKAEAAAKDLPALQKELDAARALPLPRRPKWSGPIKREERETCLFGKTIYWA